MVIAAVALLAVRNVAGGDVVPSALYVPVNLGTGLLLGLLAWRSDVSMGDVGLAGSTVGSGLRTGAVVALAAVTVIGVASAVPLSRPLFEDERVVEVDGPEELAYHAFVRIPFGTALFEEFAFRGVLLALLARTRPMRAAVAVSSLLFGLWHIRPTLGALDTNDVASDGLAAVTAVAGAVVVTAVAGVVFCVLRLRSRSVLAPVLVHASINSVALLAAYVVLR